MSRKQYHGRVCGWISTVCLHEQMLNNLTAWRHWTAQWVLLCWAEMSLLLCLLLWGILVLQCYFSSVVCDLALVVSVWNAHFLSDAEIMLLSRIETLVQSFWERDILAVQFEHMYTWTPVSNRDSASRNISQGQTLVSSVLFVACQIIMEGKPQEEINTAAGAWLSGHTIGQVAEWPHQWLSCIASDV